MASDLRGSVDTIVALGRHVSASPRRRSLREVFLNEFKVIRRFQVLLRPLACGSARW